MLQGLVGNKSVEKILLFLLVNERGYATQLHHCLHTPLTPIQKGLQRLEKSGVLHSYFRGKTRFFEFNPNYPLLDELEKLLKKAYHLLGPREKKQYTYIPYTQFRQGENRRLLSVLWERLKKTNSVIFQFRSSRNKKGYGKGKVLSHHDGEATLVFQERGLWQGSDKQEFTFRNTFRWTLNRFDRMITLEHLRFGENNPVFLFHLIPAGPNYMESLHAHLCGQDTYFGQLVALSSSVQLTWRILGPEKNDEVIYTYK